MKHELFDELDAFDPHWQSHYRTLVEAAIAANALPLYDNYIDGTEEGYKRSIRFAAVPDTQAACALDKRIRNRMFKRTWRDIDGDDTGQE